jgi:hypothetical protein
MWYVWQTGEMHTRFKCGDLRERDDLEDLGAYGKVILKLIFNR